MTRTVEEMKKQDVLDHLIWDDSVNANDVHVKIENDTVKLEGTVPNFTAKISAQRDAFRVKGVKNVENHLQIKFPPRITIPTDEEITENIKNMLLWNSRINSDSISVQTEKGVVTLSGIVNSFWEKYLALDIANSANGVTEVINTISVNPTKTVIDMDIERDIKNAFERSSLIDEDKIYVDVSGGVVHLIGAVSHYLIKDEAHDIAMYTAGVTDVVDDITIG